MRLSGSKSERGTWVEGSTPSETDAVRLRTLWNATDKLSVSLTGNWSKAGSGGLMGGSVKAFVDQDDRTYPDGTRLTDPWTLAGDEFGQDSNTNDQYTRGGSAEISWDTFLGALTITPNYSESKAEGYGTVGVGGGPGGGAPPGGAPPGGAPPPGMSVSTANNLSAQVVSAQQAEDDSANTTEVYQDRTTTQEGLEMRMASSRDFSLFTWIAGGTYNKSEDTSAPQGSGQASMDYSEPDFKYGFEWNLADNMMLYGSYSSSYRTDAMGSVSYDTATGETITLIRDPEENNNYSIGWKSRWLDNRLQVNVSTYYYDYRNSYVNEGNSTLIPNGRISCLIIITTPYFRTTIIKV